MLARRKYITYKEDGSINNIFCKKCGAAIAGYVTVPISVTERGIRWRRFPNYAEIKMEFPDGHYHVTNGCKACLSMNMPVEVLNELHEADMAEQEVEINAEAIPLRVVAMDTTGVGIL